MSKKKRLGVKKGSAQALSYVAEQQNKNTVGDLRMIAITEQEMLDYVHRTLHKYFGFGPERQKKFHDGFEELYGEHKELEKTDSPDREYAKEVNERALKAALGPYYQPRSIRYDFNIIDKYGRVWKSNNPEL